MSDFESDFPESDDLDALIDATPETDSARNAKRTQAESTLYGFKDKCSKCRGTGIYNAPSMHGHQCFKCRGKGYKLFKTSPEARAQAKVTQAARKVSKTQENLEAFKTQHPAVYQWFDGSTFPFAVAMREAVQNYGALTEKQLQASLNCVAKLSQAKEAAKARETNAPTVDLTAIHKAFANASQSLKNPKLRFAGLTISLAKQTSNNAGCLYVKSDTTYLGKITKDSKFVCTRECDDTTKAKVIEAINDPKQAAIAHGKMTGSCSCCGRELTDPQSVALGIGPICADKWGW